MTWIRLFAGLAGQMARGDYSDLRAAVRPSAQWRYLLAGALLGTFVAPLLWLGGHKWADASVGAVLDQFDPL